MQPVGVLAGHSCIADDRILLHPLQSSGLAHAIAFLHVLENADHLLAGQAGSIEHRALVLAEPSVADGAEQLADALVLADVTADAQIACAAAAKGQAAWVLTAEQAQIM